MRIALLTPVSLALLGVLTLGVACSDDEPVDDTGKGGSGGKGGTPSMAGKGGKVAVGGGDTAGGAGGAGGGGALDVCAELGGPANIDAVVRGDGKDGAGFNAFKFEKDGRKNSVLLNAATDPCIGEQFAQLLTGTAAANAQLEHFAQCLSLFMQATAGCEGVVYKGAEDSKGKVCKSMLDAHTGLGITDKDYMALLMGAGAALSDAGVTPGTPVFNAVAGALLDPALKAEIIESTEKVYSNPGLTCEAAAGGAGGSGGAP